MGAQLDLIQPSKFSQAESDCEGGVDGSRQCLGGHVRLDHEKSLRAARDPHVTRFGSVTKRVEGEEMAGVYIGIDTFSRVVQAGNGEGSRTVRLGGLG